MSTTRASKDDTLLQRSDFEVGTTLEELKLDMDEGELKGMVKRWMTIASNSEAELKTNGDINKDYYKGIDRRANDITDDKSKVTDNRIFTDLETVVPLVTSVPAKPIVVIPTAQAKNKKALRDQAIKNQKILLAIYEDQDLQFKYEKMVRQHQIWKVGVIKYGLKDDKIFADVKLPSRILLDSEATTIEDSEFIGEKIVISARDLVKIYPDKESEISSEVSGKMGTKLTYIEWWTDDIKVVSIKSSVILEAIKNPLFDYEGVEKVTYDENGKEIKGEPTMNNFFVRPRKPYVLFNVYNIGENIIDDTTPLELSKTLQDNINDRKRQIADNSDTAGNPIRTYKGMTSDQANDADNNLSAGNGVNLGSEQEISYIQAAALPAFVQNDLQDSRNSIDNIFGIHSTTRGERQAGANESGRAREALREGDEDRQATIGRAIERASEELYKGFAHLIKVFYNKEQALPILGKDSTEEYIEFKRDDIAEGMKIRVRPGSTIPTDPNALKAQGLELAGMNRITNRRLYEMLGIEDVDEAVKEFETEAVKAQQEQQKILAEEQKELANTQQVAGFEEQIQALGAGQPQ